MLLILLLLLMVDSDDLNVVTLLIQPPSMQPHSMDNMVRTYSWILHGVRTLDGQMAEGNSPDLTCIQMIGTSVCYVSVLTIASLAVLPTDDEIFFLFTRISQGSELSDR